MIVADIPQTGRYGVVLADPAWKFATWSRKGVTSKAADHHYRTSRLEEMMALPVEGAVAQDAFLFMWTTWPHLPQAFALASAWGFARYVSGGAWAKRSRRDRSWAFGTGYRFRSASEPLLLFERGKPSWFSRSERNLWVAPIREHSRKPDCVRDMIERAAGDVPRLELFSRTDLEGWDVWGDEAGKFA